MKTYIFTHIPKTAGTTFKRNILFPNAKTLKFRIESGHFKHGKYDYKDINYITFLRNPVDRWLSSCNHCIAVRNSYVAKLWSEHRNDVNAFIDECLERKIGFNIMTRQLSGIEDIDYKPDNMHVQFDLDMDKTLGKAKKNISKYKFVGTSEDTSSDFKKMCSIFGWKIYSDKKFNRRKDRKVKGKSKYITSINSMIEAKIMKLNHYDFELYKYALS